jgi:pimeloyl-ACP methyl ester carboxylesterase
VPLAARAADGEARATPSSTTTIELRTAALALPWATVVGRQLARHWRKALLAAVICLPLIAFAAAWYSSGRLMAITHVHDSYPLHVIARDRAAGTVVLSRGQDATEPGTFRLAWPQGDAIVGEVLSTTPSTVTRRLSSVRGRLVVGQHVGIEPDRYTGDPRSALGMPFATVEVPTSLGAMPAWFIPGRRRTWMILVHGLGGNRTDVLPPMPTLHALGYPMLAVSYRNDVGAPQSRDHRTHLGATEWSDLEAAVLYAIRHRAGGVVLYGYSMGGSMALTVARDPRTAPVIRAVVLDSPLLDWPATLDYAAARHGIPTVLADLTATVLGWREDTDFARFDQLKHERQLRAPVLLLQGSADTVVPPSLATRFARQRPGLVTYVPVPGADHVSAIDTDPSLYERALTRFLEHYP